MEELQKKELKFSLNQTVKAIVVVTTLFLLASIAPDIILGDFDMSYLFSSDCIAQLLILLAIDGVMMGICLYQRSNNVLTYGNYGFSFGGKTYSYSMVTKLVAVHRGRHGTYYHLYAGDEIIYKFSYFYDNKDDFIALLQKNGVLIIA